MGLIMVTGGARSGKSEFAEKLAYERGKDEVLYIATSLPVDEEMKERIKRHRERRPSSWETVEAYKDLDKEILKRKKKVVLIDCLTVMISNLLMEVDLTWENSTLEQIDEIEDRISQEVDKILIVSSGVEIIIVTNEVGMGLVPEYKLGRIFRDIAGRMNKKVAEASKEVYLMISGIPVKIKG
ncbi:adenosylcobinamide kinase/adenosylcobinamide-phosphate guanylyltransferase [Caldanaerobacter subterraneus subsp. tengcongensis MB4]|uniref:Adenosylcobinamide kinase n=1 Tax=Caldanaerobacter subterraneus subsp. tengcongensis (strain DSM 15242 / JCM 11007 / NBRC 100824 / MB4) TaxID=273068 RepID=Q8RCN9_CALS4|nr:bifunctional adenosylcobinamide kinase/adenosylcobinamide-phosphate guanylyltransferase [Caldanaerobacter subterraneus]AAM23668.1 Adenosyl cobinamide kinase/adenosyl cobinamide phosphate guanylyltransferase [Caldanaerobacter subterraneus subsp. tengcongensis MB4]MBE3578454.1 bifunctional adenosylcobinamide kinase/adenosylcobinamide-phosphate guanylyltransferase [Caldanaerobacter subterraneus]MCS3916838.1 adenosylcobinamide kinase/adenosylcobinamide-phosphate guanylyltransferase [Caldanaerobac